MKHWFPILLSTLCWGQQRPELGWFVDPARNLRSLEGVSGAPQPGRAAAGEVRVFARGEGWLAWTTETGFCLRPDEGSAACRDLDRDVTLLRFSAGGFPLRAWSASTHRFHDLESAAANWRECFHCPEPGSGLVDFSVDEQRILRLLTSESDGLRITTHGAAGEWLGSQDLKGMRAPALLLPEGWVATTSEGLAGSDGWHWPGIIPGALAMGARGLLLAWDEEGMALLVPQRRAVSRVAVEARP